MKSKDVAAVLLVLVLFAWAAWRIGSTWYAYELSLIDQATPAPPVIRTIPAPPHGRLPHHLPPDEGTPVCDQDCQGRQIIFI